MSMIRELVLATTAVLAAAPAFAQSQELVMEEFMVPASDTGIEIYVRNKHPAGMTTFAPERTLLFVPGSPYPAHTTCVPDVHLVRIGAGNLGCIGTANEDTVVGDVIDPELGS